MKLSIVVAILNSPEIARRHVLYYNKIGLPDDVEVIWIDDGGEPELQYEDFEPNFNFTLLWTHDKRPWTQPTARNIGAKAAKGRYCLFTDIDHIVPRETIEVGRNPTHDVIRFKRFAGVLDIDGNLTQDPGVLKKWGLIDRYFKRDLSLPPHGNSYIFRRDLYLKLGGVSERYCGTGTYPNREEIPLKRKLHPMRNAGQITILEDSTKPTLYMMPNGKYCGDKDYNPFGYFHDTSRLNNKDRLRARKLGIKPGRKTNKRKRMERNARAKYHNTRTQ